MLCFPPVVLSLRIQTKLVTPENVYVLLKVETIFMLISNSVGVNVFACSRPGRMTFPELVKSNQINIDSDFLKMKLLEKEAYELKH